MTTSHRILDISLRNLSIFQEGTYAYKALLEVQCDAANLDFEIDGNGLKREADGKIYTEVWNVSGGKENVFNCNNNGILKIHLTKSIISSPIYLHTTILELDDFNDEFVVNCHGKVLLHPRKRLFDANKTMVSTEHTMKLKLASLLEQEMVQVVCGWLEIVVITNVNTEEPHHVEVMSVKDYMVIDDELSIPATPNFLDSQTKLKMNDRFLMNGSDFWSPASDMFVSETIPEEEGEYEGMHGRSVEQKEGEKGLVKEKECSSFERKQAGYVEPKEKIINCRPAPGNIDKKELKKVQVARLFTRRKTQENNRLWKDAFKVNESIAEEPSNQNQTKEPGIKLKLAPNVATIVKETEDRNDSPVAGLAIEKSYFHLPDMNAVREILPKYHELSSKSESFRRRKPSVQPHVPIEEPDQSEFEEQLKTTNENTNDQLRKGGVNDILVYQAQELEKYHTIVEQMGKDINSLHKQVANLKHDKSQLSYQLTLVRSSHVEENDENSLLGQLREQLVSENSDKLELQQRVANLQNQMIKKNEIEEDYLKLQTAHEEQQRTIHDSQNKLKKLKRLEELCSEQENVLQVMEKKLAEGKQKLCISKFVSDGISIGNNESIKN